MVWSHLILLFLLSLFVFSSPKLHSVENNQQIDFDHSKILIIFTQFTWRLNTYLCDTSKHFKFLVDVSGSIDILMLLFWTSNRNRKLAARSCATVIRLIRSNRFVLR